MSVLTRGMWNSQPQRPEMVIAREDGAELLLPAPGANSDDRQGRLNCPFNSGPLQALRAQRRAMSMLSSGSPGGYR